MTAANDRNRHRDGRRPRGRGVLALAIVSLLVVGVLAIVQHGQEGRGSGPNLVARSVGAAEEAGTARMWLAVHMESPEPLPEEFQGSFEGEGVVQFEPIAAQLTVSLLDLPGAPDDAEMELRMIDTVMYLRIPGFQEETGFKTPWVSFDLAAVVGVSAEELFGSDVLGGHPAQQFDYLRGAGDDVETLGREDVRGVPTTRYRVEVDLRKAAREGPEPFRELMLEGIADFEAALGTARLPVDVWIDDSELPRRMRMQLPATDMPGAAPDTVMVMVLEMYDYGVAVDVEPPPPDDVVDFTEILRQGFQLDR